MSDIRIEGKQAFFEIHEVAEEDQESYIGEFRCKCLLNPIDNIEADRLYRNLLGDYSYAASDRAKNSAFALSQLKVRLVEYPEFWKSPNVGGGHIPYSILMTVLEKAIEAQEQFIEQKRKDKEELENMLTKKIKTKEIKEKEEIEIKDKKYEVD